MKKFLVLLMTTIFLAGSSGISFSLHYCGGSLGDVSFTEKGSCACDDESSEPGCCSDSFHTYKIRDGFVKSSGSASIEDIVKDFVHPAYVHDFYQLRKIGDGIAVFHPPANPVKRTGIFVMRV